MGGTGDDSFVFNRPSDGGDIINHSAKAAGNDDRFAILASGFGGAS